MNVQVTDVTFVAKVELLKPKFPQQANVSGWKPPTEPSEFDRGQKRLFIWSNGNMRSFGGSCPEDGKAYSAATIFSTGPSSELLSVLCDAGAPNVTDQVWRSMAFEARRTPATPTLSHVGPEFKYKKLQAPGGQACVGQLLPACHHTDNPSATPYTGLIGRLDILIALAALSTSKDRIVSVLPASIQHHRWNTHPYDQGRLRDVAGQGIVVTIYFEPGNARGSNKDLLKRLEAGGFGAFYQM